jgi:hypothetical protein
LRSRVQLASECGAKEARLRVTWAIILFLGYEKRSFTGCPGPCQRLVQPDDGLMIAGFIVQNGAVRVVVRAIGPSLVQFGISNALPDTTLQLRDQQGAIVLENDDWGTSQQQELEDFGLQPTHNLEAALVATIQPGQYTAQVRGQGQASRIGVVQVYFGQ